MSALRERVGWALGWLSAPAFAAVALARHARVFHPEGVVLAGRVEPIARGGAFGTVAERLTGPALVRFSTALWRRGKEWPDALGCAIRFRAKDEPSSEPDDGDQDLLLATIRTPLATPLGPVGTHVHDFLANRYFGTAPFDVRGIGRGKWRVVAERALEPTVKDTRERGRRLAGDVARGDAALRLELRRTWRRRYVPVVRIRLLSVVPVDQERLRFSPFRAGRGIAPRGFVHALRRGAYAASDLFGRSRSNRPGAASWRPAGSRTYLRS